MLVHKRAVRAVQKIAATSRTHEHIRRSPYRINTGEAAGSREEVHRNAARAAAEVLYLDKVLLGSFVRSHELHAPPVGVR